MVHVDSSKGMTTWAKENAIASNLQNNPIRYIVDDVNKLFIKTNGTYLRAKKIFKNINGVWTEIDIESLTDNNVYIYGGVITTNQD